MKFIYKFIDKIPCSFHDVNTILRSNKRRTGGNKPVINNMTDDAYIDSKQKKLYNLINDNSLFPDSFV